MGQKQATAYQLKAQQTAFFQYWVVGTLPLLVGGQMRWDFPWWVAKVKMTERSGPSSHRLKGGSDARTTKQEIYRP